MQANIWYDLGIGFPAFKAVLKGVKSGFNNVKGGYEEDLKHFGSKDDNYPYFNRLVSNIYKSKNAAPYIVVSLLILFYVLQYSLHFIIDGCNCGNISKKVHRFFYLVFETTELSKG